MEFSKKNKILKENLGWLCMYFTVFKFNRNMKKKFTYVFSGKL